MRHLLLVAVCALGAGCASTAETPASASDAPVTEGLPPFESFTPVAQPDYSLMSAWAAHPDKRDAADATPPGIDSQEALARVDGFYINPTTYSGASWNADWRVASVKAGVAEVVGGQASVLNGCCTVFAPHYRQAASAAVYDRTGSGTKAYALAFEDVKAAFLEFAEVRGDRPFVILGHSQGAFHTRRLLEEVIVGTPYQDRLVAAYIVGVPVPMATYERELVGLRPCESSADAGCVASWLTFGPAANLEEFMAVTRGRFSQYEGMPESALAMQCNNPLTGKLGDEAPASANLGAVPLLPQPPETSLPGIVGAGCRDGALVLHESPGPLFQDKLVPGDNYHFYDVALFYLNIREELIQRAATFLGRK